MLEFMNKKKSVLMPIAIIGISFMIAFALFSSRKTEKPAKISKQVWLVQSIHLNAEDYQQFYQTRKLYAQVTAPDAYRVFSPLSGVVEILNVRQGSHFKQGDLLASLAKQDFLPQLKAVQSRLASANEQLQKHVLQGEANRDQLILQKQLLQLKQASLKRTLSIQKKKLAAQAEIDTLKQQVLQQKISIRQLQLQLDAYELERQKLIATQQQAEEDLLHANSLAERSQIIAKFDGFVAELPIAKGEQLNPSQLMMKLVPNLGIELKSSISQSLKANLLAYLEQHDVSILAYDTNKPSLKFKMKRISQQTTQAGADIYFSPSDDDAKDLKHRLGDIMSIQLQLEIDANTFVVPATALFGQDTLYQIISKEDGNYLQSHRVSILAQAKPMQANPSVVYKNWLVVSGDSLKPQQQILTTHLPNAMSGLKVSPSLQQ